jgi:uncharacterized protein
MKRFVVALAALTALAFAAPGHAVDKDKPHRIAVQVDQNDPAVMNLALNNISNLIKYYNDKGEKVEIEVVAYGPGLNMLREDKSPVKDRLKRMKEGAFASAVTFSACHNTMMGMEKREGHSIPIVAQAHVVPSGVVRLNELQEEGYSYLRP